MSKNVTALISLFACTAAFVQTVANESRAGADEVAAKVQQAVALIDKLGDDALSVIADPSSGFMWKDTYVFVVDCDADRVVVNPAFPERVGGDIKKHTDYAGKQYGLELCEKAATEGGAWMEYVWLKPGGETPMRKVSYVLSAQNASYQVGAGIYDATTPLAEFDLHLPGTSR